MTQMDQTTPQNPALVEEMAAAASSLRSQAQELVQTVAVFKLGANDRGARSAMTTSAGVRAHKPGPATAAKPAAHTNDNDDWESV
jgi:methyl-accepting chemotaxis protein